MSSGRVVVLVVEDESLVRMAIVDHLEDDGFEVVEAANADDALAILIRDSRIEALFTDIDMPGGMDGLKLSAAVHVRWPPIRIVITSGYRKVDPETLPVEAVFFPKPYDPEVIASTIREMAAN